MLLSSPVAKKLSNISKLISRLIATVDSAVLVMGTRLPLIILSHPFQQLERGSKTHINSQQEKFEWRCFIGSLRELKLVSLTISVGTS